MNSLFRRHPIRRRPIRRRSIPAFAVAGLIASVACGRADRQPVCSTMAPAVPLPAELNEASGLAASRLHDGVLYSHNDSGGEPIVFAINLDGNIIGRVRLDNATNVDWEDMDVGTCPAGTGDCIWVADIGDNRAARDGVSLYVIPEPANPHADTSMAALRFDLRYPAGPRDAESLFVTSDRRAHVVSKGRGDEVRLFQTERLTPEDTARVHRLVRAQRLRDEAADLPDQVTAAATSPDGQRVALRTYTHLQFYRLRGSRLARILPEPGVDLEPLGEPQGEGVAVLPDGSIVLSSERGPQGVAPRLTHLRCSLDS